jgi:hypothetical protein
MAQSKRHLFHDGYELNSFSTETRVLHFAQIIFWVRRLQCNNSSCIQLLLLQALLGCFNRFDFSNFLYGLTSVDHLFKILGFHGGC